MRNLQITKPRTNRKKLFQAPGHQRHRQFSAPLSSDLKKEHGANSFPAKTGDTVRVMRGDRSGFEGKITKVDRKKYRILVESVTREKVDGTAIPIPIHPSKVMIINLNLDDKWRREALKRKGISVRKEPAGKGKTPKPKAGKAQKPKKLPKKGESSKKTRKKQEPAQPAVKKVKKKASPKRSATKGKSRSKADGA
ncbi:MAG: 50S ribosomal protein L24 [Candidatus Bathyarchaeota archaeon]|nr:50S ribosomal protein L24 [Candidatus Bathyarchaeota archaeon]